MSAGGLTWKQSILQVLGEAGIPLHYKNVTDRILQDGLRESVGKTPADTVCSMLNRMARGGEVHKVSTSYFAVTGPMAEAPTTDLVQMPSAPTRYAGNLSWPEAILHVLEEAGEELHYKEVTRRILDEGLKETSGKMPQDTVYTTLSGLVDRQRVRKVRPAMFVLVGHEGDGPSPTGPIVSVGDETLAVAACGLHWRRGVVDWRHRNASGELLGRRERDRLIVDFADQDGIYLLHDARKDIVYVGQTFTPNMDGGLYARLQEHANSRAKTSRWDYFSWFGFRPVDESTRSLAPAPDGAKLPNIINVLETILILGLDPRLNAVGGRGSAQLEANRFSQVELTVHN